MEKVGLNRGMSTISIKIFKEMKLYQMPHINLKKLHIFLDKVFHRYRRDVEYHNDIHGSDVCQMMFVILKQGGLRELAKLNELDLLSILIGSVCHDLGHDGFTNQYHVNSNTERAIRFND